MRMPQVTPPPPDDDDLDELPPLDGGDGKDDAESDDDHGDVLDEEPDDGDPLDDKTSEDDPVDMSDLDIDEGESGWLADAADAEELDIGPAELSVFEGNGDVAADFDEPGVGDEDFGLIAGEETSGLDGGEEGPTAKDEDLREEDLPRLDADEEGEVDDADLMDPAFGTEEVKLAWASGAGRVWQPVGAPLSVGAVNAVACVGKGVVAAGKGLVRVDLEGACEPLDARGLDGAVRLAADAGSVAALTDAGTVLVSRDGGATFVEASSWRAQALATDGGHEAADLALSCGALWIRTRAGSIYRSIDGGSTWDAPLAGRFGALAEDPGRGVVAIALDVDGSPDRLVRGPSAEEAALPTAAAHAIEGRIVVAARAGAVALAGGGRGLARCVDGATWTLVAGIGSVTAMSFLDGDGTLLVAVYNEVEDTTSLVRIDAAGLAQIVAEIARTASPEAEDDADADGVTNAMATDDAHGVVWVAGGFGVLAFERA